MANPWEMDWGGVSQPPAQESMPWEQDWQEAPQAPAPVAENPFAAARRQAVPVVEEEEEKPSFNVMRGIGERAAELGGNLLALGQRGVEQLQETFADLPTEITWGGPQGLSLMSPNEIRQLEEETGKTYTEMRLLGSAADAWRETELGYERHRGWEEGKQALFDPDASFMDKARGVGDIASWGFETGLVSLPDMAAVLTAMPAYLASRTNEIAEERAEADGRDTDDLEASDLAVGAGTALAVSILERFGAQRLLNIRNSGGSIVEGITKGAAVEGLTEAQQELAEYLGAQAGTERGISFLEGVERTLQGVVGGGAFGGPAGGLSAAVGRIQGQAVPQEDIDAALDDAQVQLDTAAEKAGSAEVAATRQAIPTAMPTEQMDLPGIEPAPAATPTPVEEAAPAEVAAVQETTPQPEPQPIEEDVAEGERLGALAAQVSDQPQAAGMQFIGAEGAPAPAPALVQTIEAFNLPLQEYQQVAAEATGRAGRPPVATGEQLRAVDSAWSYLNAQVDTLNAAGYDTKPLIKALKRAAGAQSLRGKIIRQRGDQPVTGRIKGGDIVQLGGRSKNTPKEGWGKVVNNFFTDTYSALNTMLQAGPIKAPQGGMQLPVQLAPEAAPTPEAEPTPEPTPIAEAAPAPAVAPVPEQETPAQTEQRLTAEQYALPDVENIPYGSVAEAQAAQETAKKAVRDSDAPIPQKERQLDEIEERFGRVIDALTVEARNVAREQAQRPKPKGGMTVAEAQAQAEVAAQPTKQVSEVKVATRGKRKVAPKAEAIKAKVAERKKGTLGLKKPAAKPTDNFGSAAARKQAASAGIPESEIEGTGRGGKIVVGDVERARVRRQIKQGEAELKKAMTPREERRLEDITRPGINLNDPAINRLVGKLDIYMTNPIGKIPWGGRNTEIAKRELWSKYLTREDLTRAVWMENKEEYAGQAYIKKILEEGVKRDYGYKNLLDYYNQRTAELPSVMEYAEDWFGPIPESEQKPSTAEERARERWKLEDATNAQETESAAVSQYRQDLREDILNARDVAASVMELDLELGPVNSGDLLRSIQAELDPNDSFSVLAGKLAASAAGNIEIDMLSPTQADVVMSGANGVYRSFIDPEGNRVRRVALRDDVVGTRHGLKVLLHELVHAATAEGTTTDNKFARKLEYLRTRTQNYLRDVGDRDALLEYGFTNVDEFIAELYTSEEFQRVLAGVPGKGTKNLWHEFIDAVAEFLGISVSDKSALAEAMSLASDLFMTEEQIAEIGTSPRRFITNVMREREQRAATKSEMEGWMLGDRSPRELMDRTRTVNTSKKLGNTMTGEITGRLYDVSNGRLDVRQAARSGSQIGLGFHTLDQIIRRFKDRFQDGNTNSLSDYQSVMRKKNQYAREEQQKAERLNEQWRQYEKRGAKNAEALGKFMHDATMSDIHPDLPFNHPQNAHLAKKKGAKEQHRRMQKRFNALPPGGRGIYRAAAKFYRNQRNDLRRSTVEHMARSWNLEKVLTPPVYRQLSIVKNPADVDAIDFSALGDQADKVRDSLKQAVSLTSVQGPYFPLRRFGKYVVEGSREGEKVGNKSYAKRAEAWEAARALRADQPFAKIRTRKTKDGTYYNERVIRTVEMFDSITEAERRAGELQTEGYRGRSGGDIGVTLKEDWNMPPGSNAGVLLSQAKRKVEGDKTLEATLDTAFLELLLENSMRKSELQRKKVMGASMDMRRAFAERAYAGSWGIADIQTALDHNDALRGMEKRHREVKDVKLGEVVRELRLRDEKSLGDRRIGKVESIVSQFGFVNYLFSPSYTMVNLTQVPLVAAPYLTARYGRRAMGELAKSYRGVAAAGGAELARVRLGAKGAPVNALDAMMNQLDQGERQAIETLADRGIIDATFMQELYKTSRGIGENAVWGKVMDLARTMPQVAEVLNRIVVARTAYNLEMQKSGNQAKAEEAASEAVLQTQFDYTDQNKPRYFKAFPGARAIMMFKMYAQGMYALIGSSSIQSFKGRTKEQRAQARKTLAGLIASHSLAGGVLGGIFMEPVRALISVWNYFTEDDDDPRDLDDDITQAIYRATGSAAVTELVTRGIPRAIGIDLSGRVGLDTMAFMGGREARSYQEAYQNAIVAAGGPVVAAGGNVARGIDYLSRGEVRRGIEAISPKLVRDALKTWRIADEGMLDYNGNIISGKQDFSTSDYVVQALGITPAQMARTYEARTAQKGRETKLRDRRKKLMMQWRRKDPKERVEFFRNVIMPYNRRNPEFMIEPGQLLRSIGEQRRREAQTRAGAFTEKAAIRRIGEAYGG